MLDPRTLINHVVVLNVPGLTTSTARYRIIGYSNEHREIRVESTHTKQRSTLALPDLESALLRLDVTLENAKGEHVNVDKLTT